ncbi:MAG: FkbM family methyltransferase [Methanoculleus sp.]
MYREHAGKMPFLITSDGVTFRRMPSTSSANTTLTTSGPMTSSSTSAPTWAPSASGPLAVEPILTEVLRENVERNGGGVTVVDGALGTGERARITWGEKALTVPTCTLGEFAGMAGGCDFLKCDCEGAEWFIRPHDLDRVRRIEMEIHMPPIGGPVNRRLLDYIGAYYDFEIERTPGYDVKGVMGVMHAVRKNGG